MWNLNKNHAYTVLILMERFVTAMHKSKGDSAGVQVIEFYNSVLDKYRLFKIFYKML